MAGMLNQVPRYLGRLCRAGAVRRINKRLLTSLLFGLLTIAYAPADATDATPATQEVILSLDDYARLVGLAGQVAPLQAENAALTSSLTNMTEQRDTAVTLATTRAELVTAYKELAEVRGQRAAEEQARVDRLATEKRREGFYATVERRMLQGALAGTVGGTALPGIGNLVGGLGGAALGAIIGTIEALVGGP